MKEESDRLKIRCFDEIEKEKAKRKPKPQENKPEAFHEDKPEVEYKVKKVKNISIANILHGAKVIETENDIDEVVGEIRKRLKEQLSEDTKLKLI